MAAHGGAARRLVARGGEQRRAAARASVAHGRVTARRQRRTLAAVGIAPIAPLREPVAGPAVDDGPGGPCRVRARVSACGAARARRQSIARSVVSARTRFHLLGGKTSSSSRACCKLTSSATSHWQNCSALGFAFPPG
jgi:hypothetical protein